VNGELHEGMSDKDYFALDALNSSKGKKMGNPQKFKHEDDNQKQSDALDFGTIFHDYVLREIDPKNHPSVAIGDFENFKTKKAQQWRDKNLEAGKIVYSAGKFAPTVKQVEGMADAIIGLPDYLAHLNDSKKEVVILWDKVTSAGQVIKCKAKLDSFNPNSDIIYDLKSTKDIETFNRDARDLGYYMSMAWYLEAAREVGSVATKAAFAVAGKSEPYQAVIREVPGFMLEHGKNKMDVYAENWRKYSQEDTWPSGYSKSAELIDVPYWWIKQEGITLD